MKQEYILTLEELSFSFAYCGYEGLAAGMLKQNLGSLSEVAWELVLQTAARSLHSKGILLDMNVEKANQSFTGDFKDLIDDIASSKFMIRCFNENEHGQFVMTAHKGRNGLVHHFVSNEIIHIISYMNKETLEEEMTTFFQPIFKEQDTLLVNCSEEQFDSLNAELDLGEIAGSTFYRDNQVAIEKYLRDILAQEGRLLNLSLIKTQDDGLPEFEDAYLLLNGMDSTWIIHNSNPDKNEDPKLVVQELTKNEWNRILKKYITSCEGNL